MRRTLFLPLATAPLLMVAIAPYLGTAAAPQSPRGTASAVPAAEVAWRTDYGSALKEARAAGKPLAVVFRCER